MKPPTKAGVVDRDAILEYVLYTYSSSSSVQLCYLLRCVWNIIIWTFLAKSTLVSLFPLRPECLDHNLAISPQGKTRENPKNLYIK
jgi:hypothetical protein